MNKTQRMKPVRFFPDNLKLKDAIENQGRKIGHIAKKIGYSRETVSRTINGYYKGKNIVPKIKQELGID